MFFTIIGVGIFCYGLFYSIILLFIDCDLQLAFYEKFGKSIGKILLSDAKLSIVYS